MNNLKRILFILLASIIPAILFFGIFDSFSNTLYLNGSWIPAKIFLKKGVWGSLEYYFSRNALANGHLHLTRWHGYQEVVYKNYISPTEISFDFLLSENSYFIIEFNKDKDQFSGIRISSSRAFKDAYLSSTHEGEFKSLEGLDLSSARHSGWNSVRIVFLHDAVMLNLNNQLFKIIQVPLLQQQQIGFRGGFKQALIDNVLIHEKNAPYLIKEDFNPRNARWLPIVFMVMVILNFSVNALLSKFNKGGARKRLLLLINGNLILSFLLCVFLLFDYFCFSKRYFHTIRSETFVNMDRNYWANSDAEFLKKQIKDRYSQVNPNGNVRIIFLGTSQIWGAGAWEESQSSVSRIEDRLNASPAFHRSFECINAGMPGYTSSKLLNLYRNEWLALKPQMVVIVLSTNDIDHPSEFPNNLRRFADINRSRGIKTIFVLEANSIEFPPCEHTTHLSMKQVGLEKSVPVWDLHSYLLQNYDKGILWWDFVHLTSFGQKLAADFLFEKISQEFR